MIAILITAKSKVLKRWKAIDARYISTCTYMYEGGGGVLYKSCHMYIAGKKRGKGGVRSRN